MRRTTIFCLAALFLVVVSANQTQSRLSISYPPELADEIKKLNKSNEPVIDCELANFGSIQYGTRTVGEAHVSDPYNACDKAAVLKGEKEFSRIPFLLVERGECAFADKVYNAQEAGAQIVVIVDNTPQRGNVIMIDNGHGSNVHITSVFITKEYGDLIKKYIDQKKNVMLSLDLIQKRLDKSNVLLWLDLSSPYSNKLVHTLQPVRQKIAENNITIAPTFNIIKRTTAINDKDTNCITYKSSVQYCAPDPDLPQGDGIAQRNNVGTGSDVVYEAIRQLCILEQSEEAWFNYYREFGTYCFFAPQDYNKCSAAQVKKVSKIDADKFQSCTEDQTKIAGLLDAEVQKNKDNRIFEWPAVTINDMVYRGNLEGEYIGEAICNSLKEIDDACTALIDPNFVSKNKDSSSSSSLFWTLVLVAIGFIIAFFITAYVFKRIARREVSQDVNQKVNQMVSQYIAFYESRGKNTGDQSDL